MTNAYEKSLFSTLNLLVYEPGEITNDARVCQAMTFNANLLSLGRTLKPGDVVTLASAKDLDEMWAKAQSMISWVMADPMYPDFPRQVMAMDEGIFRFHQMMHYFSTYGLEDLVGAKVSRGWLPQVTKTEKTTYGQKLIDATVISLVSRKGMYIVPLKRILAKKDRMHAAEEAIVSEAVNHTDPEDLMALDIPFKESLSIIFKAVLTSSLERDDQINVLHALCKHTGDVWRCVNDYLHPQWHLSTREKKTIVRLLESYPYEDFAHNLILTRTKGRKVITLLEFLSYNRFSRKPAYANAVSDLRDGHLPTWESTLWQKANALAPDTLAYAGTRPGLLLRCTRALIKRGFSACDIARELHKHTDSYSTGTLLSLCQLFSKESADDLDKNILEPLFRELLEARLKSPDTPLKHKKLWLRPSPYDLTHSVWAQGVDGGNVRTGLAFRIPEDVKVLRFFVYWNDKRRVDLDLHVRALSTDDHLLHVGWNSLFKDENQSLVYSGDLTHSDAAEYIDVALDDTNLSCVTLTLHSFTGQPFGEIETCFTGLMAVKDLGKKVRLYDPKNCIFAHDLKTTITHLYYGYIDVQNRLLVLTMSPAARTYGAVPQTPEYPAFSLQSYLDLLVRSQEAEWASSEEEAGLVLTVQAPEAPDDLSLTDHGFFVTD